VYIALSGLKKLNSVDKLMNGNPFALIKKSNLYNLEEVIG
jgi:hypothetical protein